MGAAHGVAYFAGEALRLVGGYGQDRREQNQQRCGARKTESHA